MKFGKTVKFGCGAARRPRAMLLASSILMAAGSAQAQDATWLAAPTSGDFNTDPNWNPGTVPTGTAFFGASNTTTLSFSASTTFGGWSFNPGAAAYIFNSSRALNFTGAGIVVNGGSAAINNIGSITTFSNSSTAGSATITSSTDGEVVFRGTSTAGHATTALDITFYDSSTAGSATIRNDSHTDLQFQNSSSASSATITNTNTAGSFSFRDTSTAGNATIINSGTIRFLGNSTAGNAAITNNGGVVDFSGTTGLNNDGKLSAGSIAGDGNYHLGANQLTVGSNNLSTTVSGIISDSNGSLVKVGTGTLTLANIDTYTGATTVNGGTLQVDGSITASSGVAINSGGTLAGVGTVGTTQVNAGGTFAPGNGTPGSSMAVAGSLAFQSGAIYLVKLNPSTASIANVTGTATLGGATVNAVFAPGAYVAKQYAILSAIGGVSGTFAPNVVNTNPPPNIKTDLSYDATHAFLNLSLVFIAPPGTGLNGNQQAVGNAIVGFFNSNGGIPLVYSALTAGGLTQAAGETAVGSQQTTFGAMTQFMGVMTDPFIDGHGSGSGPSSTGAPGFAEETDGANAYAANGRTRTRSERDAYAAVYTKASPAAPFDPRWSVWAAGFGGSQTTDGNAALGSNNTTSSVYGTAVGADYRLSPFTLAGFALAGGGTNFSVANGLGTGRSDLFQAGAYVRHNAGAAYLTAALAYGWQDITTDRMVTIAGVDRLRAEFNANAFSGRVEGGYRFVTPWMGGIGITPYAAGQFTTFDLPAYAEQVLSGANTFALAYGSKSVTDTRSELGIRTNKSFAMQSAILTLRGRLSWAHDFNPDRTIAATFQTLPGASFVVNGAAQASDSALITASAEVKWLNGWSAAATFEGEFSDVTRSYAGKGVARYAW